MGFKHSHSLGQNFLTDKNLLAAIVGDAGVTASDRVIEVGAGQGALTRPLHRRRRGRHGLRPRDRGRGGAGRAHASAGGDGRARDELRDRLTAGRIPAPAGIRIPRAGSGNGRFHEGGTARRAVQGGGKPALLHNHARALPFPGRPRLRERHGHGPERGRRAHYRAPWRQGLRRAVGHHAPGGRAAHHPPRPAHDVHAPAQRRQRGRDDRPPFRHPRPPHQSPRPRRIRHAPQNAPQLSDRRRLPQARRALRPLRPRPSRRGARGEVEPGGVH